MIDKKLFYYQFCMFKIFSGTKSFLIMTFTVWGGLIAYFSNAFSFLLISRNSLHSTTLVSASADQP